MTKTKTYANAMTKIKTMTTRSSVYSIPISEQIWTKYPASAKTNAETKDKDKDKDNDEQCVCNLNLRTNLDEASGACQFSSTRTKCLLPKAQAR